MPEAVVVHGDCLERLREMEDESIDAVCTDPPAAISFMSATWDGDRGGRKQWVAWLTEVMEEVLRTLKPGGHAFVWALPRTSHWTMLALEDAGFEVRDVVTHHFGSGFPKSMNVGKSLDKLAGAKRDVVGEYGGSGYTKANVEQGAQGRDTWRWNKYSDIAVTDVANKWDGWGSALKPSTEFWILCRKPLSESSIARNVLKWGCGGLNIDQSRVGNGSDKSPGGNNGQSRTIRGGWGMAEKPPTDYASGRWPSNTLLSHVGGPDGCQRVGVKRVKGTGVVTQGGKTRFTQDGANYERNGQHPGYADPDGYEQVEEWDCKDGCPIKEMDAQSGVSKKKGGTYTRKGGLGSNFMDDGWKPPDTITTDDYAGEGGSSRFFQQFTPDTGAGFKYCAKASKRERNAGLEELPDIETRGNYGDGIQDNRPHTREGYEYHSLTKNTHPTVKPLALCEYLVTMICPPGGTVLDPFAGSGSVGCAAIKRGFNFIGVEAEEDYVAIAKKRIEYWATAQEDQPAKRRSPSTPRGSDKSDTGLQDSLLCEIDYTDTE